METLGTIECEITSRCNLKCAHCYASAGETQIVDLPVDLVISIMNQLVELKPTAFDIVGGEPFLYPEIWRVLEHAKSIGLNVYINTNGTIVTNAIARSLKSANPDAIVAVSLDGPNEAINDLIRGKGSFVRAMKGIEQLRNQDIAVLLMFVVNRINWRTFDKYVEMAIKEGVEEIYVDRMIGVGRAERHLQSLDMDLNEWCDALRTVNEITKAYASKISFYVEESVSGGQCTAGRSHFSISWDGTVVPCGHFKYFKPYHLGNVYSEPIKTIFSRASARIGNSPQQCANCKLFGVSCRAGCKGAALAMTGSPDNPDPVICAYLRNAAQQSPDSGSCTPPQLSTKTSSNPPAA